jgi:hypothetical protein
MTAILCASENSFSFILNWNLKGKIEQSVTETFQNSHYGIHAPSGGKCMLAGGGRVPRLFDQ